LLKHLNKALWPASPEWEKFQNEDHPKGKKTARHCRDTTEYDRAAAAHLK
jgi:hypothetical protein